MAQYNAANNRGNIRSEPLRAPARLARIAGEGMPISLGIMRPAASVRARESLACWASPKPTLCTLR